MLQPNFRKVAFVFDRSISIAFKSGLYGGRYVPRGCNWGAPYFNFRPSARGDNRDARFIRCYTISIHAPPRGATIQARSPFRADHYFNSRPSARGDGNLLHPKPCPDISILAPPRGATAAYGTSNVSGVFQFPPLREGRRAPSPKAECWRLFQFTPLREGRRTTRNRLRNPPLFQFTPLREGRLDGSHHLVQLILISIHAPPRGATLRFSFPHATRVFQFTPLREGRPCPQA